MQVELARIRCLGEAEMADTMCKSTHFKSAFHLSLELLKPALQKTRRAERVDEVISHQNS